MCGKRSVEVIRDTFFEAFVKHVADSSNSAIINGNFQINIDCHITSSVNPELYQYTWHSTHFVSSSRLPKPTNSPSPCSKQSDQLILNSDEDSSIELIVPKKRRAVQEEVKRVFKEEREEEEEDEDLRELGVCTKSLNYNTLLFKQGQQGSSSSTSSTYPRLMSHLLTRK